MLHFNCHSPNSSDGKAPHFVVAKFTQLTCLKEIHLYLDYDRDESYTPNRIYLKAGYDEYSSVAIFESDIVKPKGWICVQIDENISALYYQILFPYNYLNGKDLRIRGLRLMGLVADEFTGSSKEQNEDSDLCLLSERASCPASPTIIR